MKGTPLFRDTCLPGFRYRLALLSINSINLLFSSSFQLTTYEAKFLPADMALLAPNDSPTGPTRTSSATSTMNSTSNPLLRRAPASADAIPHSTSTSTIRLVAPVEKRPSKHADLIDKWDGSGFGKSMLHHSGPYDAAAPSRNDAKERGAERAPMGVFDPKKGSKVTELDVRAWNLKAASTAEPGMGSALSSAQPSSGGLSQTQSRPQHGRFRSGSITRVMDSKASPGLEQEVVIPSLPNSGALPMTARPSRPGRKSSINSPGIYGSLQEEYSNNLPSSGGYFANSGSPNRAVGSPGRRISMGPGADLEEEEKRMRQREREQKRRALQAAWGIDERESDSQSGLGNRRVITIELIRFWFVDAQLNRMKISGVSLRMMWTPLVVS